MTDTPTLSTVLASYNSHTQFATCCLEDRIRLSNLVDVLYSLPLYLNLMTFDVSVKPFSDLDPILRGLCTFKYPGFYHRSDG